jgi:hypothetical protein
MNKSIYQLLLILTFIPFLAFTQENNAYFCKRLKSTPKLDGNIRNDSAWENIKAVKGFYKLRDGALDSKQTLFKMACNEQGIFLGIECEEPEMEKLKAECGDRGRMWDEDSVELFLKPTGSAGYHHLLVNTIGSRFVETLSKSGVSKPLTLKDWKAAVYKGKGYWSVEILIPLHKLYPMIPKKGDVWTGNICRNIFTSGNKRSTWARITSGGYHQPKKFNKIIFEGGFSSPKDMTILEKSLIKAFLKDEIQRTKDIINNIKQKNPAFFKAKVSAYLTEWEATEKEIANLDSLSSEKINELFKKTLAFISLPLKLDELKKENLMNEFFAEDTENAQDSESAEKKLSVSELIEKVNSIVASSSKNKEIAEQLKNRLISLQERLQKIKAKNIKLNLSKIEKMESSVKSIAAVVTALEQGKIKIKDIVTYDVEPVSSIIRTPDIVPIDGKITDTLRVILTPGEYEPASFIAYAFKDINSLKLKAEDLKSKNGTIPAKNIDIKIVKCWYQAGTAWGGIKQDRSKRVLVPELLLNDDSLIKVDTETKDNYIKLKYPASKKSVMIMRKNGKDDRIGTKERLSNPSETEYYWISSEKGLVKDWQPNIQIEDFPIKDSPVLLAIDLKKGKYQQFWITIKAPEDAKPGIYKSKIILSSQGKTLGNINLKVKVLPFKLERAKTYYDVTQKFIQGIYYHGTLTADGKGSVGEFAKTKEQLKAEALNLYKHGILNPNFHQKDKFKKVYWTDKWPQLVKEQFTIRQKIGIETDPLFMGGFGGYNLSGEYNKSMLANQDTFDKIKKNAKLLRDVLSEYNIKDVYIYGIDEAESERLVNQKKIWKVIHKEGFKVYVAGYKGAAKKIGSLLDMHICKLGPYPVEAEKMHKNGNKIIQYHNPQGGVENPELYRRNYGFLLWRANYDGAATYVYTSDFTHPWNDFDGKKYRDHNLVYPTANGVIDTIAWEGYREAMDDVRYISTLHQEILKAKKTGNHDKKAIVLSAEKYLNKLDASKSDLNLIRLEIIKYILALKK